MSRERVSVPPSLARRAATHALAVFIGATAVAFLVEAAFRLWAPPPRIAGVRASRVSGFRVVDGVPLWESPRLEPCAARRPRAARLAFFGTSITFGAGLQREQSFPHRVEALLADVSPDGVCADDFSVPGFGADQQFAIAREAIPSTHPVLVVLEIWDPVKTLRVVGDLAFDARGRTVDEAGVPVLPGIPSAVADPLFRVSHAYQYTAFALSPFDPSPLTLEAPRIDAICTRWLPELVRLASAERAPVVAVLGAPTNRPFREGIGGDRVAEKVSACARELGIPVVGIAEELVDERVEDVRLDTACHLNALGHERFAARLAPHLRARIIERPP